MVTLLHEPITGSTTIRKATPTDFCAVSSALAVAFHDDPVFGWIYPDPDKRRQVLPEFFNLTANVLAPHDNAWTTSGDIVGAALWVPYNRPAMTEAAGGTYVEALIALSGPDTERMLEILTLLEDHLPTEPHEYLWFLGVVPKAQGNGIGSALIRPVLERAGSTAAPVYLEATSTRSKALYERHGFVADAAIAVAGGPPLWPMWRRAAGS